MPKNSQVVGVPGRNPVSVGVRCDNQATASSNFSWPLRALPRLLCASERVGFELEAARLKPGLGLVEFLLKMSLSESPRLLWRLGIVGF